MEEITINKCTNPENFLEILDDCIEYFQKLREQIRQEIYYDELF